MVGLEPSDLEYQQHLYPFDTPKEAAQMAKTQSGCGLVTEEAWRAGDVADPRLRMPYEARVAHGGVLFAVALEVDIAKGALGWTGTEHASGVPDVYPADAPVIGCHACPGLWYRNTTAYEHELSVILVEDDGVTLHSVDGGQPGIAIRSRRLIYAHGELWLASLDVPGIATDDRPVKGRRAQGLSRARALPRTITPPTLPPGAA